MKDKLELNNLYRDERTVKKLPGATEVKLFRFVITDTAQLRLGPNQDFEYYSHGSMANGGGVFAAGEMGFDQTGKLRYVSNTTGHYRVPQESLLYVLYPYLMDQYNYSLEDIQSLYQGTWTRSQEDNEDESEYSCELVGERFDYTQCLAIISVNDKQNITENPASIYSTPSKSRTNTSDFSYVTP
ncbi:MAG: hypothetical protein LRY43_04550 [Gammaproteobacteria bacterium]|nr:hypothetical protein [Gammaproteobacteria bacterium]